MVERLGVGLDELEHLQRLGITRRHFVRRVGAPDAAGTAEQILRGRDRARHPERLQRYLQTYRSGD